MAKIKKAFLLSSSAILLVLFIAVTFSLNKEIKASESKLASTSIRIKILNSFVSDLENNYFEKILHVSGKSALEALTEYKLKGGNLPSSPSLEQDFSDILSYGVVMDTNGLSPQGISHNKDSIESYVDNCRFVKNMDQKDSDNDGVGDACKYHCDDYDEDGVCDVSDNCPITSNIDQNDVDKDGVGDACQGKCQQDDDKDELCGIEDNCPSIKDPYNNCQGFDNDIYALIDDIANGNMQDKSLATFVNRIENIFNNSGVKINKISTQIIGMKHNNPWTIDVEAQFQYNIEDKNHIASWEGLAKKNVGISIIGLKDPLSGEIIVKEGPSRWIQHNNPELATNGDSFLKRLDSSQLQNYGICKEDNQHCGTCENDCTLSGMTCILGVGTCI